VHEGHDIDKRLRRIDRQTAIALRLEIRDHHPHVSFEITHPETKSARCARACAVQSAPPTSIADRKPPRTPIDSPQSSLYRQQRVRPKNLACDFLTIRALCA
jgi:hypothetical protein